jgi:hypothetical protein
MYHISVLLFVIIFLSFILYKLYNTKDAENKIINRIYSDRYHIFAVFVICVIGFTMNKNKNKYKYVPFFILTFIILETVHVLTWDDQGKFFSSKANLIN